jgi:hypothetical protein
MKKISSVVLLSVLSTVGFANINVNSLDIYKNRTFVNQELNLQSNSVDLIGNVRFEDIRLIQDGTCKISNMQVITNNSSSDSLSKEIKSIEQDIAFKKNEILSVTKTIDFLTSIKFEKSAVNLKNIKDVSSYAKIQMEKKYNSIYKLNDDLKELNKKLQKLRTKKSSNTFSKFQYTSSCKSGSTVGVTYPIYNVRQNGFYEIDVNSISSNINIKNKAYITQSSGYDFNDIDINIHTYNYSNAINPSIFRAKYLDVLKKRNVSYAQNDGLSMQMEMAPIAKSMSKSKQIRRTPSYSYNETSTKAFYKASNITLVSGVKNEVLLSNDIYKTTNKIEIDGFASSNAFYKVDFKTKKLYSRKQTKLYLDSNFMGQSFINEIKKDKESSIYLGIDSFVDVKKELVKDMKEKPFFSMSKLKTEKSWRYTITNNGKTTKNITLIERLPISKHEDIKVTLNSKTKYTKKEDNGKISYDIILKANEKTSFEYGYTIEKPYTK